MGDFMGAFFSTSQTAALKRAAKDSKIQTSFKKHCSQKHMMKCVMASVLILTAAMPLEFHDPLLY